MEIKKKIIYMDQALELALKAKSIFEIPIGAIVVDKSGVVIGTGYNQKERNFDTTAHAEILAIRMASNKLSNWRLEGGTLYTTLEPCPMCLGAMIQARLTALVFGAYDFKGGAFSLNYNLYNDIRLNHSLNVVGGLRQHESSELLKQFFKDLRAH